LPDQAETDANTTCLSHYRLQHLFLADSARTGPPFCALALARDDMEAEIIRAKKERAANMLKAFDEAWHPQ
jgi:hypothetical protein